jgi:hypothetical protein
MLRLSFVFCGALKVALSIGGNAEKVTFTFSRSLHKNICIAGLALRLLEPSDIYQKIYHFPKHQNVFFVSVRA